MQGGYGFEQQPAAPLGPMPGSDPKTEPLAAASIGLGGGGVLLSCISIVCCVGYVAMPLGIAGVVTGAIALTRIKQTGAPGRGMAIAGIVTGAIAAVLPIVLFLLSTFLFAGAGILQGLQQHAR